MLRLGLFTLTVAILAACGVYGLKHRVQGLEQGLLKVERMIEEQHFEIRRLKAEWATLSRPERLARLTEAHLDLQPTGPRQIVSVADIPLRDDLDPLRDDPDDAPALVSSITPEAGIRAASTVSIRQ